ncbi:MAG: hypothetical protein AAF915_00020 [Cyanobacteria bacterium P01_D01_bin.50]
MRCKNKPSTRYIFFLSDFHLQQTISFLPRRRFANIEIQFKVAAEFTWAVSREPSSSRRHTSTKTRLHGYYRRSLASCPLALP